MVGWVEGELVARRTLPGAGGEDIAGGLWKGEDGEWEGCVTGIGSGRFWESRCSR